MTNEPPVPSPRLEPPEDDLSRRAARLQRELSQLLFELVERRQRAGAISGVPKRFPLRLNLELFHSAAVEAPPEQLLEQLRKAVDRWARRAAKFPPGRVYCYWCQSYTCEHSTPAAARDVFAGYSSIGQPEWRELGAVLLARRDPRIERVYQASAPPVTVLESGSDLRQKQLPIYGKHGPVYRLLAQAAVGYVQVTQAGERIALTFQAAEIVGARRIVLNILGSLPKDKAVFEVLEAEGDPRIADALDATRRALAELSLRRFARKRRAIEKERRSLAALRVLARHLERAFRQGKRRTRHSQARHLDRRRPAASALGDALKAKPDSIYRDVEERTWVIIGPKNRVHVFNDGGQHITSVVYSGDTIRGRTRRGKWLTAPETEREAFGEALRRQAERD